MTDKPIGSAIRTYTGTLFDFLEPEKSPISIEDIAHALSLLCRFAGHCKEFYSVAEHSYRVSYVCPPEHALWGLMHDASEAYCVDVPRPLKHMPNMEHYRAHEKRVQRAICGWFKMVPVEPPEVKAADMVLLVTEQRDLLKNSIPDFRIEPLNTMIKPVTSRQAEKLFIGRFKELTGDYKSTEKKREYAVNYYHEHREDVLKKHKENNKKAGPKKKRMPYKYPESRRKANLKPTGWTPEMMDAALIEQGNKCAICREVFITTPHCDHKHVVPPEPRALLCGNCNRALGLLKENPEYCEAAAEYLRNWS